MAVSYGFSLALWMHKWNLSWIECMKEESEWLFDSSTYGWSISHFQGMLKDSLNSMCCFLNKNLHWHVWVVYWCHYQNKNL